MHTHGMLETDVDPQGALVLGLTLAVRERVDGRRLLFAVYL